MSAVCPCGTGRAYSECCRSIVRDEHPATTAEQLMRSRYTAYVRRDGPHLLRTWHPERRPRALGFDDTEWLGLEVLGTEGGGPDDAVGTVTFAAQFVRPGEAVQTLGEVSEFVRLEGRWVYVDGVQSSG